MIEIDEELVEIAKEHMAFMSDCSDHVGRADSCFDDDLTTLVFEDGEY
jgi:spermidine synthase